MKDWLSFLNLSVCKYKLSHEQNTFHMTDEFLFTWI